MRGMIGLAAAGIVACAAAESSFTVSDPFIWRDDGAKCYRLYQLSRMSEPVGAGVMMRTSTNLTDWSAMTQVLRVPDSYGCSAVWAPEMHVYKGAYYIFGTICTKLYPTNCVRPMAEKGWQPKGNYLRKRLSTYIFKADRPEGPFKVWSDGPIPPRDWATLDGTFFEEDGKPYMVFCHEWTQMRDGTMDAVELTPDLKRAAGKPMTLFRASDLWKEDAAKFPARTYVTDGPFLYRSKTGELFMLWSSARRGYLQVASRSASGKLHGPWTDHTVIYENDSGHGMVFRTFEGTLALALHSPNHPGPQKRLRIYELEDLGNALRVGRQIGGARRVADVLMSDNRENKVVVDPSKVRFPVSEDMWGIFFEDIDLSLDGGVYAELVRNRSFEDGLVECRMQKTIGYWHTVGHATIESDASKPISEKNRTCGRVDALPGGGVANDGYFGIAVKDGAKYRLSVALRGEVKGGLEVALKTLGKTLATGSIRGVGPEWKTFTLTLEAKGTDSDAKLVFTTPEGGTFYLDCVSLFPCDTYGTSGLFRKDLMERLAALKPSFVRFPGGCWVEGDTMAEAYRWKQTIGNVWDRRTQWNLWGYWSANGVGFHEYLVLCEELGAKALFCINCGMSHKETVPLDKMGEFVQDALDCIEYANGPVTSKWGAVRAANGHPAPFNLQYLEIGNENGGEKYYERYALIHDAVRAKYPEIKIVSDVWHGVVKGRPQHIRDEHHYRTPDWFMSVGAKLYDDYPRDEFEVFVGEYAVTRDVGRWGDLRAAIGEAAFMCGLERNADVVKLAAYAPLFANAKHTAWRPNLIYPMTDGNFVNPSWNVQKLFSENRGREVLAFSQESRWIKTKDGKTCRAVAVSAVRDADGSVLVKAVNCSEEPQPFTVALAGAKVASARKTWFTGHGARASNSPLAREALKELSGGAHVADGVVVETLPPLSLTVFRLH